MCVRNTVLVKQERGDPCWQRQSDPLFAPANLLIMTPTPSIEIPAKEKSIAEAQRTSGKVSTTRSIDS